jgi:hypothetical protein
MPPVDLRMLAVVAETRAGVLATIKRDGRPQLSPVLPYYDRAAGIIYVSIARPGRPRGPGTGRLLPRRRR